MSKRFTIELATDKESEVLPIHFKTLEYFEEFVLEQILKKYKVILNSKWTHSFVIFFDSWDYKNIPEHVKLFDGIDKHLVILPPNSFSKEAIKSYSVQFFITKIKDNPNGEFIGFCEMMLDFIETFFTINFKKIKTSEIGELKQEINWDYLKSLNYPAKLEEQKYIGK